MMKFVNGTREMEAMENKKISRSNFKLAAMEFTKDFMVFAHYYQISIMCENKLTACLANQVSFEIAESSETVEQLQNSYKKSVENAMRKLFKLDKLFFARYREHIVEKLDSFESYEQAIEEITDFASNR